MVFAFGGFCGSQNSFLDTVEVSQGQFGIDNIYVVCWADSAFNMDDVLIVKAAHHVSDCVGFTNSTQKFIAQTFTFGGAGNQTGNIDKFHAGGNYAFRFNDRGDQILARIGNRHNAGIGLNGTKGEIFRADARFGKRIKKSGFTHVR